MGATVPQMGAAAPIVMQMGATDLRSHPDGGCVQNSLQMGATVPQMGATFSIVLQMGATDLCSHPDGGGVQNSFFNCYADSRSPCTASSKFDAG